MVGPITAPVTAIAVAVSFAASPLRCAASFGSEKAHFRGLRSGVSPFRKRHAPSSQGKPLLKGKAIPQAAEKQSVTKPGPKPRLSRQIIVEEACLLLSAGEHRLTMANLARNLGSGVMSLYRYFRNREELLDAIGEHLIGLWQAPEMEGRPWQDVLYDWLSETQRLWDDYPAALRVIFWNTSRSSLWAGIWTVPLIDLLKREGMDDEKIAFATYWLGTSAIGCIVMENQRPGQGIDAPAAGTFSGVSIDTTYVSSILDQANSIQRREIQAFSFRNIIQGIESLMPAK